MTSVLVGYALVFGVMAAYAARVLSRGRSLARRLPDEDKPWI
jgi:hypothetical protein